MGTLTAATVVFLFLIAVKVKRRSIMRRDFTFWVWAFMAGWLGAEILALLAPPSLELTVEATHFAVVLLFAVFLTVRWSWALRGAAREGAP